MHMKDLLSLPYAVWCEILTSWLGLADIARLDSSVCSQAKRPSALALLYSPVNVYDSSLIIDDLSVFTAENFASWLLMRDAEVTGISVSEAFVRKWDRTEDYLKAHGTRIRKIAFSVLNRFTFPANFLQRFRQACPNVTEVSCPGSFQLAEYEMLVEAWPKLTKISTAHGLCDAGLLLIAQFCRKLEYIDIAVGNALSEFAKARFIVSVPGTVKYLRMYSHGGNQRVYQGLYRAVSMANLPLLRVVDLYAVLTDDVLLEIAQRCPLLDTLLLQSNNSITGRALHSLPSLCRLQCIRITSVNGCSGLDIVSLVFANRATLRTFQFDDSDSTTALLTALSQCAQLQELDISPYWDKGEVAGWSAVAQGCPRLISLRAVEAGMTDDDLCAVARGCPRLQRLTLHKGDECKLTDRSLQAIAAHCPDLRALELRGCDEVTDIGFCAIAVGCTRLSSLKLGGICSDITFYAMAQHSRALQTLHLDLLATISEDAVMALAKGCTGLRHVRIETRDRTSVLAVTALAKHCAFLRSVQIRLRKKLPHDEITALTRLFRAEVLVKLSHK
jgi:hypothetical protein